MDAAALHGLRQRRSHANKNLDSGHAVIRRQHNGGTGTGTDDADTDAGASTSGGAGQPTTTATTSSTSSTTSVARNTEASRTTSTPSTTSTTSTSIEEDTTTSETSTTPTTTSTSTTPTTTSTTSSTPEDTTTTILSTSTSTQLPDTTSDTTTLESTTSSDTTTSSSSTSRSLVTSFVTASASRSLTSATSSSTSLSSSGSTDSSGPSAGTVVGIVAGALVGVVVLSGIVGYFFRTKCSKDKDDDVIDDLYNGSENPFGTLDGAAGAYGRNQSRGEMRRDSQMLGNGADDYDDLNNGDGNSVHQMSELGHGGNHYRGPSYGENNMINTIPVGGIMPAAGAGAVGAYQLNRANTTGGNINMNMGMPMNGGDGALTNSGSNGHLPGLQRNDTLNPRPPTMIQRHYAAQQQMLNGVPNLPPMQGYQGMTPGQFYPSNQINQPGPYPTFPPQGLARNGTVSAGNPGDRAMHAVPEEYPARSGTPEYTNPQQYFHQAHDSFSSNQIPFDTPDRRVNGTNGQGMQFTSNPTAESNDPSYPDPYPGQPQNGQLRDTSAMMNGPDRAKRALSVRNGGLNDVGEDSLRESVYGGTM